MAKAKNRKKTAKAKKQSTGERMALAIARRDAKGKLVRPSQTQRERDSRSVAVEARRRLMGLTVAQACDPLASYPIGVLLLAKMISRHHHDAAYDYALCDNAWRSLKGMPRANLPAVAINGGPKGKSTRPAGERDDLMREYTLKRDAMRARVSDAIGNHGLALFDAQVLRDEPMSSPLATIALVNGVKALCGEKG